MREGATVVVITKVADLLRNRPLRWIEPGASARDACRKLRDHRIGALAVCRDGELVGIVSERDMIVRIAAVSRVLDETSVDDVMTPDPQTIDIGSDVAEALERMLDGHFRHLPVLDEGRPVGMISMRDIPAENRFLLQRWRDWQTRRRSDPA